MNSGSLMAILPPTEKQGGPAQIGGWQKEMARRRYQKGSIRKRGRRKPVWELQWWEDYVKEDGSIGRRRRSVTLGAVSEMTLRQARKLAEQQLRPVNQGILLPQSTMDLRAFVDRYFEPLFFPTLKRSTQKRYRQTLNTHLLPAFGKSRLCDIGTLALQSFVLQKMESGLGWESANHLRNLMSKNVRDGKEVEPLVGKQSRHWGVTSREKADSRKTRAPGRSDSISVDGAQRTCSHHGSFGHSDRYACRRDFGTSSEGRGFSLRPDSNRASLLSWFARLTQDQRQQTFSSPATSPRHPVTPNICASGPNRRRRTRISDSQRHSVERHQPASSPSETGRLQTRSAIAQLAHSQTNPRNVTSGSRGFFEGCASTTRSHQDVHNLRGLYPTDPGASTAGRGESFAIGDEW